MNNSCGPIFNISLIIFSILNDARILYHVSDISRSFDKLLHTPQRNQHDDSVLFRTPKMKQKSLTSPTDSHSSGKRSRKCLFKNKSRRDEKNCKKKTKKVNFLKLSHIWTYIQKILTLRLSFTPGIHVIIILTVLPYLKCSKNN